MTFGYIHKFKNYDEKDIYVYVYTHDKHAYYSKSFIKSAWLLPLTSSRIIVKEVIGFNRNQTIWDPDL